MRELRVRPDLDQLRRQARELLRAAQAGDPRAVALVGKAPPKLTAAQHALAREYGFASWPKLKASVEERRRTPPSFVMRYVASPEELRELWRTVAVICGDPEAREHSHWHIFERFDEQRRTMLVLEHEGLIVGGTIALKLIGVEPWARGIGLGRRLWQTVEAEAMLAGRGLGTHADPHNIGFFLKLGYQQSGRSKRHMYKGTPAPRVRELRLRRWRERAGDLERGVVLTPDPQTGKVPALPW